MLLSALVIGPIVSGLPPSTYFGTPEPFSYVFGNLTMWQTHYLLPGVFVHNPYPATVNGSIWTIRFEVRAYLIVACLGVFGLLRDWRAVLCWAAMIVIVAAGYLTQYLGDPRLLRAFAVGSLLYLFEDRVPLRWDVACVGIAVWVALSNTSVAPWLVTLAIPYFAVVAARKTPRSWSRLTRFGDFSYGLYLWAFLIQQMLALIPGIGPIEMIAAALPLSYAAGAASWVMIERRALQLKPGSTAPRKAAVETA